VGVETHDVETDVGSFRAKEQSDLGPIDRQIVLADGNGDRIRQSN